MDVGDVTAWASSVDTQAGLDGSGTHMDSPVFEDVKVGLSASITWKTSYTLASVLGGIYIFGPEREVSLGFGDVFATCIHRTVSHFASLSPWDMLCSSWVSRHP